MIAGSKGDKGDKGDTGNTGAAGRDGIGIPGNDGEDAPEPVMIMPSFNSKQDILVSGLNIKTINGDNVLGSGDLTVSGAPASFNPSLRLPAGDISMATNYGLSIPKQS